MKRLNDYSREELVTMLFEHDQMKNKLKKLTKVQAVIEIGEQHLRYEPEMIRELDQMLLKELKKLITYSEVTTYRGTHLQSEKVKRVYAEIKIMDEKIK